MWFLPDDKEAVTRLKKMIAAAQKTVHIAMFTWTRKDLAQAVADVSLRGIKVEVALDHFSQMGPESIYQIPEKKRRSRFLSEGSALLGHKFMVIDGETQVNGLAN